MLATQCSASFNLSQYVRFSGSHAKEGRWRECWDELAC